MRNLDVYTSYQMGNIAANLLPMGFRENADGGKSSCHMRGEIKLSYVADFDPSMENEPWSATLRAASAALWFERRAFQMTLRVTVFENDPMLTCWNRWYRVLGLII